MENLEHDLEEELGINTDGDAKGAGIVDDATKAPANGDANGAGNAHDASNAAAGGADDLQQQQAHVPRADDATAPPAEDNGVKSAASPHGEADAGSEEAPTLPAEPAPTLQYSAAAIDEMAAANGEPPSKRQKTNGVEDSD